MAESSAALIRRKQVVDYFLAHPEYSIHKIAKITKFSRYTVNRIIRNYQVNFSIERKPGSGRKPGSADINNEKAILKGIQQDPTISCRALSKKLGIAVATARKMLQRNGFEYCPKKKKFIQTRHVNTSQEPDKQKDFVAAKNEIEPQDQITDETYSLTRKENEVLNQFGM